MKLRNWVKEALTIISVGIVLALVLNYHANRIEKINNGQMKVINETQMAERN